jgi:hypothetical protein
MWKRSAVLLIASLALGACAANGPVKTEQLAAIPACQGSDPDDACDSGKPLCALNKDDTCLMCRCMPYQPLSATLPSSLSTLPSVSGLFAPPVAVIPPR